MHWVSLKVLIEGVLSGGIAIQVEEPNSRCITSLDQLRPANLVEQAVTGYLGVSWIRLLCERFESTENTYVY